MTTYSNPLEQRFEAKIRDLAGRLAVAEQQLANTVGSQLISRQILLAPTSTVTIPASGTIPQTFTNLRLVICAQSTGTGADGFDAAGLQFNGVSSASYNWRTWWVKQGDTSVSTTGGVVSTNMQIAEVWNAHFGTSARGIATIEIPGYADTSTLKSFTSTSTASDGGTSGIQQAYSGTLSGTTAAITSLTVLMGTGQFITGSTFSLYGN